jgi:hypothetical protein
MTGKFIARSNGYASACFSPCSGAHTRCIRRRAHPIEGFFWLGCPRRYCRYRRRSVRCALVVASGRVSLSHLSFLVRDRHGQWRGHQSRRTDTDTASAALRRRHRHRRPLFRRPAGIIDCWRVLVTRDFTANGPIQASDGRRVHGRLLSALVTSASPSAWTRAAH